MILNRNNYTATLLKNGNVLVSGGAPFLKSVPWSGRDILIGYYLPSAEIYNPTINTWSSTSAMNKGRGSPIATLLKNGKVMVFGGTGWWDSSSNYSVNSGSATDSTSVDVYTSAELYDSSDEVMLEPLTIERLGGLVVVKPKGIDCRMNCEGNEAYTYISGTQVTLTASANTGFTFAGWSGSGCTGKNVCVITMNAPQAVTALFNAIYSLIIVKEGTGTGTVTSQPLGINCGTTCNQTYDRADRVTLRLTAKAASNAIFTGWSGGDGCSGTGTCVVTMYKNQTVKAIFNQHH